MCLHISSLGKYDCVLLSGMIMPHYRVHNFANLQTKVLSAFSHCQCTLGGNTFAVPYLKREREIEIESERDRVVSCVFHLCSQLTWEKVAAAMSVSPQP